MAIKNKNNVDIIKKYEKELKEKQSKTECKEAIIEWVNHTRKVKEWYDKKNKNKNKNKNDVVNKNKYKNKNGNNMKRSSQLQKIEEIEEDEEKEEKEDTEDCKYPYYNRWDTTTTTTNNNNNNNNINDEARNDDYSILHHNCINNNINIRNWFQSKSMKERYERIYVKDQLWVQLIIKMYYTGINKIEKKKKENNVTFNNNNNNSNSHLNSNEEKKRIYRCKYVLDPDKFQNKQDHHHNNKVLLSLLLGNKNYHDMDLPFTTFVNECSNRLMTWGDDLTFEGLCDEDNWKYCKILIDNIFISHNTSSSLSSSSLSTSSDYNDSNTSDTILFNKAFLQNDNLFFNVMFSLSRGEFMCHKPNFISSSHIVSNKNKKNKNKNKKNDNDQKDMNMDMMTMINNSYKRWMGITYETNWLKCMGKYTLGAFIVNKIEMLLWYWYYEDYCLNVMTSNDLMMRRILEKKKMDNNNDDNVLHFQQKKMLNDFLFHDLKDDEQRIGIISKCIAKSVSNALVRTKTKSTVKKKVQVPMTTTTTTTINTTDNNSNTNISHINDKEEVFKDYINKLQNLVYIMGNNHSFRGIDIIIPSSLSSLSSSSSSSSSSTTTTTTTFRTMIGNDNEKKESVIETFVDNLYSTRLIDLKKQRQDLINNMMEEEEILFHVNSKICSFLEERRIQFIEGDLLNSFNEYDNHQNDKGNSIGKKKGKNKKKGMLQQQHIKSITNHHNENNDYNNTNGIKNDFLFNDNASKDSIAAVSSPSSSSSSSRTSNDNISTTIIQEKKPINKKDFEKNKIILMILSILSDIIDDAIVSNSTEDENHKENIVMNKITKSKKKKKKKKKSNSSSTLSLIGTAISPNINDTSSLMKNDNGNGNIDNLLEKEENVIMQNRNSDELTLTSDSSCTRFSDSKIGYSTPTPSEISRSNSLENATVQSKQHSLSAGRLLHKKTSDDKMHTSTTSTTTSSIDNSVNNNNNNNNNNHHHYCYKDNKMNESGKNRSRSSYSVGDMYTSPSRNSEFVSDLHNAQDETSNNFDNGTINHTEENSEENPSSSSFYPTNFDYQDTTANIRKNSYEYRNNSIDTSFSSGQKSLRIDNLNLNNLCLQQSTGQRNDNHKKFERSLSSSGKDYNNNRIINVNNINDNDNNTDNISNQRRQSYTFDTSYGVTSPYYDYDHIDDGGGCDDHDLDDDLDINAMESTNDQYDFNGDPDNNSNMDENNTSIDLDSVVTSINDTLTNGSTNNCNSNKINKDKGIIEDVSKEELLEMNAILRKTCLRAEAELATLRNILAVQSTNADVIYPQRTFPGHGSLHVPQFIIPEYGLLKSNQASSSRHSDPMMNQMEIMSDDGAGMARWSQAQDVRIAQNMSYQSTPLVTSPHYPTALQQTSPTPLQVVPATTPQIYTNNNIFEPNQSKQFNFDQMLKLKNQLSPALGLHHHHRSFSCSGFGSNHHFNKKDLRSNLCSDIESFIKRVNDIEVNKLALKNAVLERCRNVVQSLWPRAQVKPYGSFVLGLSLPASDLDLVIVLPKVRKDAPADTPGALEGRNAIKETWQQNLARYLRNSKWIDPASMKIISHTTIPIIKVKTCKQFLIDYMKNRKMKDDGKMSKAPIYLDISFEGGQHNGLAAVRMINSLIQEMPAIKPIVIILKQFMNERGLMESYSGGLSSYALVLMVARYLQEQSQSMDTGSVLIGFLDFYSNHFDPRLTGISVNRRCYFNRGQQPGRRYSNGTVLPYKFDPLYIEDPMNPTNNVGRNCFRIFQILRAWNDAWMALNSSSESEEVNAIPGKVLGQIITFDCS